MSTLSGSATSHKFSKPESSCNQSSLQRWALARDSLLLEVGSCYRWALARGGLLLEVGSCYRWALARGGLLLEVGSC